MILAKYRLCRLRMFMPVVALMILLFGAARPAIAPNAPIEASTVTILDLMIARARAIQADLESDISVLETEVQAIERRLLLQSSDTLLVRRIASALVREARRNGLDPRLLTGVLLTENPWLRPDTTSFMGAVGLMQVMPMHAGAWGCGSDDLTDVDVNICHGARIFAHNLRRANGDVHRALLYYNGCVRGTNTPNCWQYPYHVQRYAAGLIYRDSDWAESD